MDNLSPLQFWMRRFVYLALGIFFILQAIIPLDLTANRIPGPDVIFCITMAYVIRRPEFVPLWAVVLVFFLHDILSMAPLGIWTLLVVITTEIVRSNLQVFREYFFAIEWLWIVVLYGTMLVVRQIMLALTLSTTPSFVDQLYQFFFTAALYPVIVGIMRYGFGIERPAAGKTNARGQRL